MALLNQTDYDRFCGGVQTRGVSSIVESANVKLNMYQRSSIALKATNIKKVVGHISGDAKADFKFEFKKGHWVLTIKSYTGTTRQAAIDVLSKYDDSLGLPPNKHARMPYGFTLFKPKNGPKKASLNNFKTAQKATLFHSRFVRFCIKYGIGCRLRKA